MCKKGSRERASQARWLNAVRLARLTASDIQCLESNVYVNPGISKSFFGFAALVTLCREHAAKAAVASGERAAQVHGPSHLTLMQCWC